MSLFDFFFPNEAQATHLRRIADQGAIRQRLARVQSRVSTATTAKQIDVIQKDLDSICLVLEALLEKLDESGVVSRKELAERAHEIDARDGVVDGKITKEEVTTKPKLIIPQ